MRFDCFRDWKRCAKEEPRLGKIFGRRKSRKREHPKRREEDAPKGGLPFPPPPPSCQSSARKRKRHELLMKGELEEVFKKFDKNGDGMISETELSEVLRSLGAVSNDEEIKIMLACADLNGDGFIDLSEFLHLNNWSLSASSENGSTVTEEELLRGAFRMFDVNGDGVITAEELHRMLRSIGDENGLSLNDCRLIISRVDDDGDGLVNFHDFRSMMTSSAVNHSPHI